MNKRLKISLLVATPLLIAGSAFAVTAAMRPQVSSAPATVAVKETPEPVAETDIAVTETPVEPTAPAPTTPAPAPVAPAPEPTPVPVVDDKTFVHQELTKLGYTENEWLCFDLAATYRSWWDGGRDLVMEKLRIFNNPYGTGEKLNMCGYWYYNIKRYPPIKPLQFGL